VRGIIVSPEGMQRKIYTWGLGNYTNNRAKALALLQGLKILQQLGFTNSLLFRDLKLIVSLVNNSAPSNDLQLSRLRFRISNILENMPCMEIFQIPMRQNAKADKEANKVIQLGIIVLCFNEDQSRVDPIT